MREKYIAGLSQFYFKPDYDWTKEEAKELYEKRNFKDIIHYSDCVEGMKKLPNESIDLIIADPPFGINFNGKESVYNRKNEYVVDGYNEIKENYDVFSEKWIKELPRILKFTGSVIIFSGWSNLKDVLIAIDKSGLIVKNHLIWKYQFGVFTKKKFVTSHYHILYIIKNEQKTFFNRIEHYNEDVWEIKRTNNRNEEKNGNKLPEEIIKKIIDFLSKPGDVILDPFLGNGTTALVAKKNFRHYIGFEINMNMRNIIERNINNVKIGEDYEIYTKKPDIERLKEKYPKAYKTYMQKELNMHSS